jgi:hypothetical protein
MNVASRLWDVCCVLRISHQFVTIVSYTRKMFMILTSQPIVITLLSAEMFVISWRVYPWEAFPA